VDTPRSIVVTGATGFTGPFVVRQLSHRFPAARLRCFVRRGSPRGRLDGVCVQFAEGDLHDSDSVAAALEGADTLVNIASLGFGWVDSLFAAIRRSTLSRGVFVSTTALLTRLPVKSRPLRERGEQMVRESGLAWTIVRPTMIYGTAEDRNIARLIRFVRRSPVVPVIAPDALQQPVHVEDVAWAIGACLAAPRTINGTYNLSGRDPLTFESLVRETVRASGRRCAIVRLPFTPVLAAVRLYSAVASTPRISVEQVLRLKEDKAFDHTAARTDFGFSPRSFADGVREEVRMMTNAPR
jgi:uncharacterized protein YbjT (DUF2867 family)